MQEVCEIYSSIWRLMKLRHYSPYEAGTVCLTQEGCAAPAPGFSAGTPAPALGAYRGVSATLLPRRLWSVLGQELA